MYWKSITALILIHVAILTNWNWLWILLFGLIVYKDIQEKQINLFDHVEKKTQPTLYWCIIFTWIYIIILMTWSELS